MAYLRDLTVNKISFVHKAANKRKFILLKSGDDDIVGSDNKEGDIVKMRKEVKDSLITVMKSEKSPDKITEILKADASLNITEAELAEVSDFIEVINAATCSSSTTDDSGKKKEDKEEKKEEVAETKKEESGEMGMEKEELLKANQDLVARLEKMEQDQKRRDLTSWVQKECAFLPEDVEKAVETIMQLEAVSKEAAEKYKDTLQKSSAAIANSQLFREAGVSTDALLKAEGDGFDLVRKVSRAFDEVRKSDKPLNVDAIKNIVNSFGGEYENYRKSHTLRAKTQVL